VIVLDAYAVLALLKGEPAAAQVRALLEGNDRSRLTALGSAEVVDHLVRLSGASEDDPSSTSPSSGWPRPSWPIQPSVFARVCSAPTTTT
jgi:predicted nucleic acid-binding protein